MHSSPPSSPRLLLLIDSLNISWMFRWHPLHWSISWSPQTSVGAAGLPVTVGSVTAPLFYLACQMGRAEGSATGDVLRRDFGLVIGSRIVHSWVRMILDLRCMRILNLRCIRILDLRALRCTKVGHSTTNAILLRASHEISVVNSSELNCTVVGGLQWFALWRAACSSDSCAKQCTKQ